MLLTCPKASRKQLASRCFQTDYGLVIVLDASPQLIDVGNLWFGCDDVRYVLLKGNAVRTFCHGGDCDVGVARLKILRRKTDADEYLSGARARSPQVIVIMAADDRRELT